MDKLQTRQPKSDAIAQTKKTQLPPFAIVMATELNITAQNYSKNLAPETIQEWLEEFSKENPEAIKWSFRQWRRDQEFMPTIAGIRKMVSEWRVRELERITSEKQAAEQAVDADRLARGEKQYGWTSPEVATRLKQIVESKELETLSPEKKNELKKKLSEFVNKNSDSATSSNETNDSQAGHGEIRIQETA